MSASTQTPWLLTGKTRLLLRIFWALLTLLLLSGYAVAFSDNLQSHVDALRNLQSETQKELDVLLPSILDRAFKGEL